MTSRRAALGLAAGGAALVGKVEASQAAYGEAANVFGSITNTSGFLPYEGDGFTITVPSKWNPSKEREYDGTVLKVSTCGRRAGRSGGLTSTST